MNNECKRLFITIAEGCANIAEAAMNKEGDISAAETMRNNFLDLKDKLAEDKELTFTDISNLYLGSTILVNNFDNQIKRIRAVQSLYRDKLIPRLKECLHVPKEELLTTFEKKFSSLD